MKKLILALLFLGVCTQCYADVDVTITVPTAYQDRLSDALTSSGGLVYITIAVPLEGDTSKNKYKKFLKQCTEQFVLFTENDETMDNANTTINGNTVPEDFVQVSFDTKKETTFATVNAN